MSKKNIGDYAVTREIGQGSLGAVYFAEHRFLKRAYALKVLPEELAQDQEFVKRFEKEVEQLATLDHPHIVKTHNISFADGHYFLVTDCIVDSLGETTNLAQYLAKKTAGLSEEEVMRISQQIASALDYAHQKSGGQPFAHHGLKLNNVLIQDGMDGPKAYLSDFGLSRIVGAGRVLSRTFKAVADIVGSHSGYAQEKYVAHPLDGAKLSILHLSFLQNFPFLAPEQKKMSEGKTTDYKVDIYAFGVLVYYLLMREFPEGCFELPSARYSDLKGNWDSLITRCLQPDPQKRPSSLQELFDKPAPVVAVVVAIPEPVVQIVQEVAPAPEPEAVAAPAEELKPVLKAPEIARPEFEPDPGAIFKVETSVGRYEPQETEIKNVEPLLSDMIIIQSRAFRRGSNSGARDEMPRHAVNLSSYALDAHPVTNEQFVRFVEAMGGEKDVNNNDIIRLRESRIKRSAGKLIIESGYAKHPVVGVTWYGAVAYSKWVGKRLPTEAEWEVAASCASEEHIYPTGNDIERTQANFFSADTTAVMSYPANEFGLYDMAGNVYEWCQDWYGYHYYDVSLQEPENPKGPQQGVYRILRGGCWKSLKEDLRCSHRHRNNPGTMNGTYGFRCAADVS